MKKPIYILALGLLALSQAHAETDTKIAQSYVVGGYRLPASLYQLLKSGLPMPVLLENSPGQQASDPTSTPGYIQIGKATLFVKGKQLGVRDIQIDDENDSQVQLSQPMQQKLVTLNNALFNDSMQLPLNDHASFTLDVRQLRLLLNIDQKGFGTLIKPREVLMDAPSATGIGGTMAYDLGGYSSKSSRGVTSNSGYLNFNSTLAKGVDHLILNGAGYTGNSFSADRNARLSAALWERDFLGLRYAAGMLDSWNMQSVASVSALSGGEVYGFSVGNAANSRQRDATLSLTPIVVFFPAEGEAHIRRDGNLIGIQHFAVGNHELDTAKLPFGIYTVEVEVVSGGKRLSSGFYPVNKPFSSRVGDSLRWQVWGGAWSHDQLYRLVKNDDKQAVRQSSSNPAKETTALLGTSLGRHQNGLDWNLSGYLVKNTAVSELWASAPLTKWLSLNTQGMSASDGSWRANYGGNLRLPFSLGNVWYSHNELHSGQVLSLYENRGDNWGVSINLPALGPAAGGVLTWSEDRDTVYGYKRRRLDYAQGLYAGRWGSVRLRTGIGYIDNNSRYSHYSDRERYVMLDFSIPLGNSISMGVSQSRETGTAMNLSASRSFDGDYLKNATANLSRTFSGDVERGVTGGATANIDTPFNSNMLSYQTDNTGGWNTSLRSQGSLAFAGAHIGAGKGRDSAGVMIDTGLQAGEKLTLDIDGNRRLLQGNRNYVSLPPYARYRMEILNNADTLESFDISDNARKTVTVYPGNVLYLQPEVKKIITVFGRLVSGEGQAIANREIKNRVGLAQTDADGRFVIDIDRTHPQLDIATHDDSVCALKLNITSSDGALWLGNVQCDEESYVWQQSNTQGTLRNEKTGS